MASRPRPTFDPRAMVAALAEHRVVYILVGGVAARLQGSPLLTQDLDLAPEPSSENLDRLASTLRELRALEISPSLRKPIRVEVRGRDFQQQAMRSYTTRLGRMDVFRTLTGGKGYDELAPDARSYDVGGLVVRAASLDDVIASKEAAGRPKDIADLVRLRELQQELRARGVEQDD